MIMRACLRASAFALATGLSALGATAAYAQDPLPEAPGKEQVVAVCSKCHEPQRVAALRLTREGWEEVVAKMQTLGAKGSEEDFKKITASTVPLLALTHRAEWNAIDRYDYLAFSMGFRQAVNDLADAARRQSADGVAYSYVRMTMACVACHRSLRDVKKP